ESWAVPGSEECLAQKIGARVSGDREVIDLAGRYARDLQTCADGFLRESRPVLYAPETLLLDGRHQLAVTQQDGGHVAVVGVDPKDDHLPRSTWWTQSSQNGQISSERHG